VPNAADKLDTLRERASYLAARIAAKESVGWDYAYDERERDALRWAIAILSSDRTQDNGSY
jgi:hypothetical protein